MLRMQLCSATSALLCRPSVKAGSGKLLPAQIEPTRKENRHRYDPRAVKKGDKP